MGSVFELILDNGIDFTIRMNAMFTGYGVCYTFVKFPVVQIFHASVPVQIFHTAVPFFIFNGCLGSCRIDGTVADGCLGRSFHIMIQPCCTVSRGLGCII